MNTSQGSNQAIPTRQRVWASPWLIRNEVERIVVIPFAWLQLRSAGVQIGNGWKFYGRPIIQRYRGSTMKIGKAASIRSHHRSNPMVPNHPTLLSTRSSSAVLRIGDYFGMTGGAVVAQTSVEIGNHVMIGANTIITDTDFHPLELQNRLENPIDGDSSPIMVHDHVFIGMQCIILKGVTLGEGCVIGAGSIITRDVEPYTIVAGNPIRTVGTVPQD